MKTDKAVTIKIEKGVWDGIQNFTNDHRLISKAPVYKFFPSKVTIPVNRALSFKLQQIPLGNEL